MPQGFWQGSLMLFALNTGGNVLNYLFQVVMGRLLPAGAYGEMNALFSIAAILAIPCGAVTLFISNTIVNGQYWDLVYSLKKNKKALFGLTLFGLVILFLGLLSLRGLLQIEEPLLFVVITLIAFSNLLLSACLGILHGFKLFVFFGALPFFLAFFRIVIGVPAGLMGGEVLEVLWVLLLSYWLTLGFYIWGIRRFRDYPEKTSSAGLSRDYLARFGSVTLLITMLLGFFFHLDILLMKHYFPAEIAGAYSGVSVLAKAILYFPTGIAVALFPFVAGDDTASNRRGFVLFLKSLLVTAVICGSACLFYGLFPDWILTVTFGEKYRHMASLLVQASWLMALLALLAITAQYQVARKMSYALIPYGLVFVQLLYGLQGHHRQMTDVLQSFSWSMILALLLQWALIMGYEMKHTYRFNPTERYR